MKEITIRTSERGWLQTLTKAYRDKQPILIVDDAGVGIDPSVQSLLDMGRKSGLAKNEWAGILLSLGMSGFGVWMVVAAILDPEPTSKLGLLVSGGAILVFSGGFSAIRILTNRRPPSVEITTLGIRIGWD